MCEHSFVSIIIPTYNSADSLGICLKSIVNQTYKEIEIMIVDNFSQDQTVEIAKKYNCKIFQLAGERACSKNYAIEKVNSEYILFIDSDMELTKKVIEECVELAKKDDSTGGIIIPERSVGNSFWVDVRDYERKFYSGTEIESARFFRKLLAERVGGFDEDIIFFEESILPQKIEKLGYNVKARISSNILHHEEKFDLFKHLKKKYYYGKTMHLYKEKYSNYSNRQANICFRIKLFLNNISFFDKPSLSLFVLILKGLEFTSLTCGFLSSKIMQR